MNFGSIDRHLAFQIHLTWRAARKALLVEMHKGEQPVPRGALSIPILIGLNPGITPMQLANALHLDASKVALFLRGLTRDGLVTRKPSQQDRRTVELYLTPAGEDHARAACAASEELERPFEGILDEEETETLIALLAKLRGGLPG